MREQKRTLKIYIEIRLNNYEVEKYRMRWGEEEKELVESEARKRTKAAIRTKHYNMLQYIVKWTNIFLKKKLPTTIEEQLHSYPSVNAK